MSRVRVRVRVRVRMKKSRLIHAPYRYEQGQGWQLHRLGPGLESAPRRLRVSMCTAEGEG